MESVTYSDLKRRVALSRALISLNVRTKKSRKAKHKLELYNNFYVKRSKTLRTKVIKLARQRDFIRNTGLHVELTMTGSMLVGKGQGSLCFSCYCSVNEGIMTVTRSTSRIWQIKFVLCNFFMSGLEEHP